MIEETSRSLPPLVLHPATGVLFLLLLRAVFRTPHASGRLLLIIVWLRYVMQAYHEMTYATVGGVSINAIVSLLACCAGALILFRQLNTLVRYPIILALLAALTMSGLVNGAIGPLFETLLKWGYFLIILLAVQDCMRRDGDARIFGLLLWAFLPLLVYQALSIGLNVSKAGESDGSVSFIGGFNHEAAFSIALVTFLAVVSLAPNVKLAARLMLLVACLGGLVAANYRTSLIAAAPIAAGYFIFGIARWAPAGQRFAISLIGMIIVAGGLVVSNVAISKRLDDLQAIAGSSRELIRPTEEFTSEERQLLSGRLYVWNRYIEDYKAGSDTQLLIGYGPDSWVSAFGLYAHNTLVSYLYEFGLTGALLIILVWLAMIARAVRIHDWALRWQLVGIHVGFVLLNMATMPFWMLEGLIFYGLLCGYTCEEVAARRIRAQRLHPLSARTLEGMAHTRRAS